MEHISKRLMIGLILLFISSPLMAQLKYNNGFTIAAGMYSSAGVGVNPYAALRYNHYLSEGKHFAELSFGISSVKSETLRSIANAQYFESSRLITYEFLYGYDSQMFSSFPYLLGGVAGINQGGQSKFAVVFGLGNRLYFSSIFGSKKIGLRYDIRDQMFSQSFNNRKSFLAHNLVLTLNMEFYY